MSLRMRSKAVVEVHVVGPKVISMLLSSDSASPVVSVQKFNDAHISCEDSSGTGENDDLSMISLVAKLMSLVLSRATLRKCSSLLGNISLSVLRLQSGCALAVLATSVLKFSVLVDVPTEDSMDGRSSSESSSKTLDNFALFICFTCTCSYYRCM